MIVVSDWDFDIDAFRNHYSNALSKLFSLLEKVEESESKLRVLSVLSSVISRMGSEVLDVAFSNHPLNIKPLHYFYDFHCSNLRVPGLLFSWHYPLLLCHVGEELFGAFYTIVVATFAPYSSSCTLEYFCILPLVDMQSLEDSFDAQDLIQPFLESALASKKVLFLLSFSCTSDSLAIRVFRRTSM